MDISNSPGRDIQLLNIFDPLNGDIQTFLMFMGQFTQPYLTKNIQHTKKNVLHYTALTDDGW